MDNQYRKLLIKWGIDPEKGAWEICRELTQKRNECRGKVSSENSEAENLEYTKQAEELKEALAYYQDILNNSPEKEREVPVSDGFDMSKFKKKRSEKKEDAAAGKGTILHASERSWKKRYDEAAALLKTPDRKKGLEELLRLGEEGFVEAQFCMGKFYSDYAYTIEVEDNEKAAYWYGHAERWYEKAANQGHAKAQYELGCLYDYGRGVEKDEAKAFYWYEKAAQQDHDFSQYSLGEIYYYGSNGVEQNYEKAFYWYERAAKNGEPYSLYYLGEMLRTGTGVEKDLKKAAYWFSQSPDYTVWYDLAEMLKEEKDYAKAAYWYEKSAERDHEEAQYELGNMLRDGTGVEKDLKKAAYWFEKAAAQGHEKARENYDRLMRSDVSPSVKKKKKIIFVQNPHRPGDTIPVNGEEIRKSRKDETYLEFGSAGYGFLNSDTALTREAYRAYLQQHYPNCQIVEEGNAIWAE